MKRFGLILILMVSSLLHADPKCESHASKRVIAAANLTRKALKLNLLTPEEIRRFFTSGKSADLFQERDRTIGNLDLRNGIKRALKALSPEERADLKQELEKSLQEEKQNDQLVEHARDLVREVLAPKVIREFTLPNFVAKDQAGRLSIGMWNGRPVFMAGYTFDSMLNTDYVLFDPFNEDKDQQVVHMGRAVWTGSNRSGNLSSIIEIRGKSYYVAFDGSYVYDLNKKERAKLSVLGMSDAANNVASSGVHVIAEGKEGMKAFVPHINQKKLMQFDLSHPKNVLGHYNMRTETSLKEHKVGDRTFVSAFDYDKNTLYLQDLDKADGKMVPIVKNPDGIIIDPLMYEDEGRIYILAMVAVKDTDHEGFLILRVDIDSLTPATFKHYFNLRGKPVVLFRGGAPFVHFYSERKADHVLLEGYGDLRTFEIESFPTDRYVPIGQLLKAGDRELVVGGDRVGPLHLFDYELRQFVTLEGEDYVRQIQSFSYKGVPYVMIMDKKYRVKLVQLFNTLDLE